MNNEVWKVIKNYENYEISSYGRIRLLRNKILLKPSIDSTGYKQIVLSKNNIRKSFKIHKLVAAAFLDKKDFKSMPTEDRNLIDFNKLQVNHKNEFDKQNNSVDNLEYCTILYNCNYGTRPQRCTKHQNRKVQMISNDKIIKTFNSLKEAQAYIGIKYQNISACCRKTKKTAGGYEWRYANE